MQVRKVLLKKKLLPVENKTPLEVPDNWTPNGASQWVGIGHYDEIFTFSDDCGTGLKYIRQCNDEIMAHNNEYEFFYPLFLITPENTTEKATEYKFWNKNRWFLSVSRIHLSESGSPVDQFNELSTTIREDICKTSSLFYIYHSIELSDMVLVIKSNSLSELLHLSLTLRKYKDVGRSYTYIGINKQYLLNKKFPDNQDTIPLFSMRFAVRNPDIAKMYIDQAVDTLENCTPYNVAGVDDIVINCESLKVHKLIELFCIWFSTDTYGEKLLEPFSEITTRLGTDYDQTNPNEHTPHNLYVDCKKLLDLLSDIKNNDTKMQYTSSGWFNPLTEICNVLVRMSQTSVMDEFVYLLLPGIKAFLQHIAYRSAHSISPIASEIFNILINECSHLMEQIMRIEGQLSHQPELRPVVYDIPVFLLEYIMAFLNTVVPFLQRMDETPEVTIKFLIVPSLCEHIASLEIFSANPSEQIPGLVLVKVPVKLLYEPQTVLLALCHETAHFAGEKIRNRDERKMHYILAASTLMAEMLFKSNAPELKNNLNNALNKCLENHAKPTISVLQSEIQSFASKLVENESLYIGYAWNAISCTKENNNIHYLLLDERKNAFIGFCAQLANLTLLFKDIHADICMYHLLKLTPSEYVNAVFTETYGKTSPSKLDNKSGNFALRLYITLCATEKDDYIENITVKDDYNVIWKEMVAYIKEIKKKTNIVSTALKKYAVLCNSSLQDICKEDNIKTIREMYNLVKSDVNNYQRILEYIQQSRNNN